MANVTPHSLILVEPDQRERSELTPLLRKLPGVEQFIECNDPSGVSAFFTEQRVTLVLLGCSLDLDVRRSALRDLSVKFPNLALGVAVLADEASPELLPLVQAGARGVVCRTSTPEKISQVLQEVIRTFSAKQQLSVPDGREEIANLSWILDGAAKRLGRLAEQLRDEPSKLNHALVSQENALKEAIIAALESSGDSEENFDVKVLRRIRGG